MSNNKYMKMSHGKTYCVSYHCERLALAILYMDFVTRI